MLWKRVEIVGSWASARTASMGVSRPRPVMALAVSNCTLSSLSVMLSDSQGAQAAAAYSSTYRSTAM